MYSTQLELFGSEDAAQQADLMDVLARYRVNLVVDNGGLSCAPALVEDNPLFRSLFGSIEYQVENDVLVTDFSRIRAGSLLRAHGGFLLLHLRDLLGDPLVWEKLRRFLRSGRLQIEEPGTLYAPNPAVSLEPEAVDVAVKIILVGSREHYYELQEEEPEFGRYFRIKVDFAESFKAGADSHRAAAIFIAHTCRRLGLPHFSASAVARLLEEMHREADDQLRLYAVFAYLEQLVTESAALAGGDLVQREPRGGGTGGQDLAPRLPRPAPARIDCRRRIADRGAGRTGGAHQRPDPDRPGGPPFRHAGVRLGAHVPRQGRGAQHRARGADVRPDPR